MFNVYLCLWELIFIDFVKMIVLSFVIYNVNYYIFKIRNSMFNFVGYLNNKYMEIVI